MELTWLLNGVWRGPGEALEASWGSLGALKDAWSAKGGRLGRSRGVRGELLEPSWDTRGPKWLPFGGPFGGTFRDTFCDPF